jgi:hypothetical protein
MVTRHPRTGRQARTWICSLLVAAGLALVLPASALASVPSASGSAAISTGTTTATVEGEVNPGGQTTEYHVAYGPASSEWCTSFGSKGSPASSTTPVTLPFTDATFHPVSVPLSGLSAGSKYCEAFVASNASGTGQGFAAPLTAGAPSTFIPDSSSTGATTTTVEDFVNPAGQTTEYHVAYALASSEWCTSHGSKGSPASSTTPVTLGFTDGTFHRVSVPLSGLTAEREYCAEPVASNASGTGQGKPLSFTAGAPSAFIFNAFSTGATTATVEGEVNPTGQSTQYHVAYDLASSEWCTSHGSSGSPASSTTPVTLGFTDETFHPVSVPLSGLTAEREYCAELVASNASGTAHGGQVRFSTPADEAARKQHEEEAAATKKHEEEAAAKKHQEEEAAATAAKKHQEEEAAATAAKKHQEEEAAATAAIARRLREQLPVVGPLAGIGTLLKSGVFSISFKALQAGTAVINWYQVPPGAKLATKAKPKPVLVASGRRSFSAAGTAKIKIKLTAAGKRLLKHAKKLKLTAKGTFTPTGKTPITATKVFVLKRR